MFKGFLMGRMVNDVEYFQEKNYCKFSVAINRKEKEKQETDYVNCVAFGKIAETLRDWTGKGKRVNLVGSLKSNKKDNTTYWGFYVENIELIDFKEEKKEEEKKSVFDSDDFPF